MAGATDDELVEQANGGGRRAASAFEALLERHEGYVLRVAYRYCGDKELARDAAQETFLDLLKRFPPPEGRRLVLTGKLTTLLYPIAKHAALRARQKRDRLRTQPDPAAAMPHPQAPASPGMGDDGGLAWLVAGLSEAHREVVLLRFVDGLTVPEVAARLDVPPGTVKSRLHHAVAQLRRDPRLRDF